MYGRTFQSVQYGKVCVNSKDASCVLFSWLPTSRRSLTKFLDEIQAKTGHLLSDQVSLSSDSCASLNSKRFSWCALGCPRQSTALSIPVPQTLCLKLSSWKVFMMNYACTCMRSKITATFERREAVQERKVCENLSFFHRWASPGSRVCI